MIIQLTPNKHPHEDVFEDYAFDRLSGEEAASFEEHLLVCEECQIALARTDEYIQLMKAATVAYLAEARSVHPRPIAVRDDDLRQSRLHQHGLNRNGLRWNVAAAAILLLTCLTALLSWRTPASDPATVALVAYRGKSPSTNILAPARRPLDLKIDLKDVQPATGYRVEVVDATGHRVWFGGTPARLMKGLAPGTYWVRLFTDSGELLREFSLRAV